MLKQLKEDIQAVFARDPAARNTLEVLTTYPGIHALIMHRVAHELWKRLQGYSPAFIFIQPLCHRYRNSSGCKDWPTLLLIMVWV